MNEQPPTDLPWQISRTSFNEINIVDAQGKKITQIYSTAGMAAAERIVAAVNHQSADAKMVGEVMRALKIAAGYLSAAPVDFALSYSKKSAISNIKACARRIHYLHSEFEKRLARAKEPEAAA